MALKILLADDNLTAQKMGCKILSDAGHTVVAVSNGAAAMKKITAEKPELVLVDVYMPGYNGLEVCQKLKNAPETARVPVLLTVTNMEPFSADEGNRVHADGVLIKPFEATDLLAVVHKFEEKLHAAADAAATQKVEAVKDFDEWKAEAGSEETVEVKAPAMPREIASAPALGIEGLAPAATDAGSRGAAPAFAVEAVPAPFAVLSHPLTELVPALVSDLNAPAYEAENANAVAGDEAMITPPTELEFTSAPQTGALEVAPAPELEITAQEAAADVPIVRDAALVTDPTQITQFATKFGEEHPEDIAVGIALEPTPEVTELSTENVEAIAPASLDAPRSPWGDQDNRMSVFSGGAAAAVAPAREPIPDPEVGVETQPIEPPPESTRAVAMEGGAEPAAGSEPAPPADNAEETQKLVMQFVAELERAQAQVFLGPEPTAPPDMEPPAAAATAVSGPDEQRVSEAVSRVLERYKDQLVAAIVRELKG